MPELSITDFSGGATDDYIDGPLECARKMDNLLVSSYAKPIQRPGIAIYNSSAPQIPPGNQAIDSLYYFDSTLFVKSGTKLYYLKDGDTSYTTLSGPTGNDAFADSELGAKCSWSEWKGHLFITPGPSANKKGGCRTVKVYRNSSGDWTLVQAGLPQADDGTPVSPDITADEGTVNGVTYSYDWYRVFTRSYTAKVNGVNVTFKDFSAPIIVQYGGHTSRSESGESITFDSLTYTNASGENYDTANMKAELYRTKTNAVPNSTPYFVQAVSLSDHGFLDNVADTDLGPALYEGASDGIFNDPPPKCYFSGIQDGYSWFVAGVDADSGELEINRVWQGKVSDPDSVPAGNYADIAGDKPTAFSFAGANPVVFFRNRCFRLEGRFDTTGGGFIRAILISAVDGSLSQDVNRTTDGIYFNSENGFCYTNGFQVINLSKHLRKTYKALGSKTKASIAYHAKEQRCYFGVESSLSTVTGKNNSFFILDETWTKGDRGTFTTASSGANLQPSAVHYDSANGRLLIGDSRGYVFTFDETLTTDPVVDTTKSYSQWYRQAIIYDWISVAWAMGTTVFTKWVTKLFCVAKNLTGDLSIDLFSINDDKSTSKQMKAVRDRDVASGMHRFKRFFPKGGLRCIYKQIQLKKGNVVIARSDDYALATTNTGAKTVLLASGTWPNDGTDTLVGHSIYFEADGYTAGYVISVQSGDTLTLATTPPAVTAGKWEIKGYPKNETLELHGITAEYSVIGESYTAYASGGEGGN